MKAPHPLDPRRPRLVAILYALFAILWIWLSDSVALLMVGGDPGLIFNVLKGTFFVATTALALYLALAREYTIQRKIAKRLKDSWRLHSFLFRRSNAPKIVVDPATGKIVDANRAACRFYGYRRNELRALTMKDISPDEWSDPAAQMESADLEGPYMVARHRKRNGAVRDVEVFFSILPWEKGSRLLSCIIIDVTDRRRAETDRAHMSDALRGSLDTLQMVIDSAPFAIVTLDEEGRVVTWNAGAERTFGYSAAEALGEMPPFVTPEKNEEFRANVQRVLDGHPIRDERIERRRKDGSPVTLLLHGSALGTREGQARGALAILEDITHREEAERRLREMATFDALTGLHNRTSFISMVQEAIAGAAGAEGSFAIHYLDLDDFKTANDVYGHDVGDALLTQIATRLRELSGAGNILARMGGDEFALLHNPIGSSGEVERLASQLLTVLQSSFEVQNIEFKVSVSIGVAVFPGDGRTPEELLRSADMAMYSAKAQGRDRWAPFSAELAAQARERHEVEAALRHAVARGELLLHYQPIVELQSGKITGLEALLRWQHPERGLTGPNAFIHVAETSGIIRPIGRWVLREVCRVCKELGPAHSHLRFAMNLSFAQFSDPHLIAQLQEVLDEAGMDAGRIELELTESMLAADAQRATGISKELRGLGFNLAIDDFGTGYSSLAYLKRFDVDRLKIDREFVMGLPGDTSDLAIVRAAISVAAALGLKTVAEGVETEEQAALLRELGCHEAQGYYFGRPAPLDEVRLA